jgi:hypothetical protein
VKNESVCASVCPRGYLNSAFLVTSIMSEYLSYIHTYLVSSAPGFATFPHLLRKLYAHIFDTEKRTSHPRMYLDIKKLIHGQAQ